MNWNIPGKSSRERGSGNWFCEAESWAASEGKTGSLDLTPHFVNEKEHFSTVTPIPKHGREVVVGTGHSYQFITVRTLLGPNTTIAHKLLNLWPLISSSLGKKI